MKKFLILIMLILPSLSFSQDVSTYLIMNDIGEYKFRPKRVITIGNAGILVPTGHFPGHGDMTYEGIYIHPQTYIGVEVKVTQHSGSDSDRWLLHEVEDGYRDNDDTDGRLGLLSGAGVKIREIGGSRFFYWGLGGGSYTWISGQKVVEIKYTDLQRTKPEPIEVIQAYLQKHPSTIPATLVLDKAHDEKWIKDEMERRLWLCDKWFEQLQLGKSDQRTVLEEVGKNMGVFLDYREKYYGISARDDKIALSDYLDKSDTASIQSKLTEYKNWWSVNKTGSLIGILSVYTHKIYNQVSNLFRKIFSYLASLFGKEKGTGGFKKANSIQ